MSARPPVDFSQGKDEVLKVLADDSDYATFVLEKLLKTSDPLNAFIDIADMNMRGPQISFAYAYCGQDVDKLVEALLLRDERMVAYVNDNAPEGLPPVRQHGEQTRIPQVDFAVKSAVEAQGMDGITERLDEGAEEVHTFFLGLIRRMQAEKRFTVNMRVNLGLEGGHTAVFVIALAELQDKHGQPYGAQPQNEDQHVAEVHAEIVAERGDVPPLPPEVQKAMSEGRW